MDPREEIRELIEQAAEHLRYYRELGVTHIGEESKPEPVAALKAEMPAQAPQFPQPVVAPEAEEKPIVPSPQRTQTTMPKKKDDPGLFDAPSLFKEAAPPAVNETLEDIRADLGDCQRCKLWTTRTNIVFGEGSSTAELMFIGEGPGADEDASGRPFVGRAGQLLSKMIEAIDLKREDVYIANVVKSRPPNNRAPEADEVKACIPFLYRQIAVIRPKLIVTLGNPATQSLLETKVGITKLRGQFQDFPRDAAVKVIPTFHPAYLLRSPDKKREAWEDLKKVRAFLRGEIEA
ncbi:MAG: uracil-DNA glycosylase [Blastocatellia bacterium]